MKRILFIKMTSLGDLIHALPAFTDAKNIYPDLKIDWVIDQSFSEVAHWHTAVDQIYTTSHRNWRKNLLSSLRPISQLVKTLRSNRYDWIIDGQGNFKSALLSACMRGPKAGFDRHSIREPIASLAYGKKCSISLQAHAIQRLRELLAHCLNYSCPTTPPDFQILRDRFTPSPIPLPSSYVVFIHNAAWKTKLWPESHGLKLIQMALDEGYSILLPWGNEEERQRALRFAIDKRAIVLPKLSLSQLGTILLGAKGCLSMDTGLSHLIAALNIPAVTLYGSTDSGRIGTSGENQLHVKSSFSCSPCNKKTCRLSKTTIPCLAELDPERVWKTLLTALN